MGSTERAYGGGSAAEQAHAEHLRSKGATFFRHVVERAGALKKSLIYVELYKYAHHGLELELFEEASSILNEPALIKELHDLVKSMASVTCWPSCGKFSGLRVPDALVAMTGVSAVQEQAPAPAAPAPHVDLVTSQLKAAPAPPSPTPAAPRPCKEFGTPPGLGRPGHAPAIRSLPALALAKPPVTPPPMTQVAAGQSRGQALPIRRAAANFTLPCSTATKPLLHLGPTPMPEQASKQSASAAASDSSDQSKHGVLLRPCANPSTLTSQQFDIQLDPIPPLNTGFSSGGQGSSSTSSGYESLEKVPSALSSKEGHVARKPRTKRNWLSISAPGPDPAATCAKRHWVGGRKDARLTRSTGGSLPALFKSSHACAAPLLFTAALPPCPSLVTSHCAAPSRSQSCSIAACSTFEAAGDGGSLVRNLSGSIAAGIGPPIVGQHPRVHRRKQARPSQAAL